MQDRRLQEMLPQLTGLAQMSLDASSLAPFRRTLRDWSLMTLLESAGVKTIGDVGILTTAELQALPLIGVQNGDDIVDLLTRITDQLGAESDVNVPASGVEAGPVSTETQPDVENARARADAGANREGEERPQAVTPSGGPTVGQQFPALEAISGLTLDDPALRGAQFEPSDEVSHLWLGRTGAHTIADVLGLLSQDFLDLRGMGPTKLANLYAYLDRLAGSAFGISSALNQSAEDDRLADRAATRSHIGANLRLVAEWARMIGGARTWGSAMALRDEHLPSEVRDALRELLEMELPEVADVSPITSFLADDPRQAKVLRGRFLLDPPRTLQDLAAELEVTRERVRQIESKAVQRVQSALQSDPSWSLVGWAIERLQHHAGSIAPIEALDEALPSWTPDERRLIAMLAGYERSSSILVRVGTVVPSVPDLPMLEGTASVVDEFAFMERLESLGVLPKFADFVISSISSVARVDGQLVVWRGSAVEKAVAVLEVRDEPQDVEQLMIAVAGDTASRSIRNRIFEDARIMRVTKTKVGLRQWGGSRYTTVADLMRDRLSSGPMDLDDLAEELAQRYEVSAASVRMYGSAPMFKVTGNTIALRSMRDPFIPRDRPSKVKGLYRDRAAAISVWCLSVDADMLRGSGRAVPQEIAVDLGIAPGARIDLATTSGDIPLSWSESSNQGPQIGSVRELVESAGVREDDPIALRFHCDRSFLEFFPLKTANGHASPSRQISAWTSLPPSLTSSLAALASTLEVEAHEVISILEARGDERIAALARGLDPEAQDPSPSAPTHRPADRRPSVQSSSATVGESTTQRPPGVHRAGHPSSETPGHHVGSAIERAPISSHERASLVEFDAAISDALDRMRDQGFDPKAIRRLVNTVGAHRVTEMLVGLPEPSEAFVALYRLGRLDLTIEAHVACQAFRPLFATDLVDAAVARLAEHDYSVDE